MNKSKNSEDGIIKDYSKERLIYFDKKKMMYFSVRLIRENAKPNGKEEKWLFEKENGLKGVAKIYVEVICRNGRISSKLFSNIIKHIDIVLEEWHKSSTLLRMSRCSSCVGTKSTLFNITEAVHRNIDLECRKPGHNKMAISSIFPDLTFEDCPEAILPQCETIINKEEKPFRDGGVGELYKATLKPCVGDNVHIAMKVIKDQEGFLDFKKEAKMMSKLGDHPYIVTFFGIFNQFQQDELVMEFANKGSLSSLLKIKGRENYHLNRTLLYRFSFQIADAINYMHWLNIYHRDLKPGNVLLFSDNDGLKVKVTDFGTSRLANSQGLRQICGTHYYHMPEMFTSSKSNYTSDVDIYAFGLILYYMLTLEAPFQDVEYLALKNIMKEDSKFKEAFKLSKVRKDSICLQRLMQRCTAYHPQNRDISGQCLVYLLQHPCFLLLMNCCSLDQTEENITPSNTKILKSFNQRKDIFVLTSSNSFKIQRIEFVEGVNEDLLFWCRHSTEDLFEYASNEQITVIDACVHQTETNPKLFLVTIKIKNTFYTVTANNTNLIPPTSDIHLADRSIDHIKKMLYNSHGLYRFCKCKGNKFYLQMGFWPLSTEEPYIDANFVNVDNKLKMVEFRPWNPQFESGEDVPLDDDTDIVINDNFMVIVTSNNELLVFTLYMAGQSFSKPYHCGLDSGRHVTQIFLYGDYLLFTYKQNTTQATMCPIKEDEQGHFFVDKSSFQDVILENNIGSITAFCVYGGSFWLGTSAGFIHVFSDSYDYKNRFQPYKSPVLSLTHFSITDNHSNVKNFVASYSTTLNENAFQMNYRTKKVYPSDHKKFSFDRKFLNKNSKSARNPNAPELDSSKDLVLFWNIPEKNELKLLNMERAPSDRSNRKHSMFKLITFVLSFVRKT